METGLLLPAPHRPRRHQVPGGMSAWGPPVGLCHPVLDLSLQVKAHPVWCPWASVTVLAFRVPVVHSLSCSL